MIKFFRKIRQRLIAENRFSKYVLYAIGEIVLVMIGILLALQINTWNSNRLEAKEEKQLLINLKSETEDNQKSLNRMIKIHQRTNNQMMEFLKFFGPNQEPIETEIFETYISTFLWAPHYSPQKGIFNSALSTGGLGIIEKENLRFKISGLNRVEGEFNDTQDYLKKLSQKEYSSLSKEYPLINMRNAHLTSSKRSSFPLNQIKILQSKEFESLINLKRLMTRDILDKAKNLQKAQEEIIDLINSELK